MNTNPVRILLVDDHIMLRKGLCKLIEEQSGMLVVGEASTSQSALEQVRALSPDIVVMDIHLPDDNGIAISRRILNEFPKIK